VSKDFIEKERKGEGEERRRRGKEKERKGEGEGMRGMEENGEDLTWIKLRQNFKN
jgi:hypothetical protein